LVFGIFLGFGKLGFGISPLSFDGAARRQVVMTSFFQMPTHLFAPPRGIPHHEPHPVSSILFQPSVLQFFSLFP
jgi:hypothetical protein